MFRSPRRALRTSTQWPRGVWCLALCACVACHSQDSDPPQTPPEVERLERDVIYGEDDRQDWYAHPDAALRTLTQESIVALIREQDIDESDPANIRFTSASLGESFNLCRNQRFWDQPSAGWCSGTLIDDDLVLTAGHCVENMRDCRDMRYVFNYYMTDETTLQTITSEDVYTCRDLVVQRLVGDLDYAIIQLDRPVSLPHRPAPVRLVDEPLDQDQDVTVIGFGSGIPAKIDTGGRVIDPRARFLDYFKATTDTFGGNSGSGAFNSAGELVGILVRGATDYVPDGFCFVVNELPENGGGQGEDLVYPMRAIEELCDGGFDSERLCGGTGGRAWCEECARDDECMPGWVCRAPGENPEARTCVPPCQNQGDCRVDHACVDGFCRPGIQSEACHEGDVWGTDVCGNRQVITDRCTDDERCEGQRCLPDVVLPDADLSIVDSDVLVRPSQVALGESVDVVFTIRNVGGQPYDENVRVRVLASLENGPTQVLDELTLNNGPIAPGGRITQPFLWVPPSAGVWRVTVELLVDDPTPSNDRAGASFVVMEEEVNTPPRVDSLELVEVGDGDGFFEEGERVRVVWSASDNSAVVFATAEFAGRTERLDASGVVLDVPSAGSYTFSLTATDDHAPPATSAPTTVSWTVFVAHPSVTATTPLDGALNIPQEASVSAVFDIPLDPATVVDGVLRVEGNGVEVEGSIAYDIASRTLRWTPSAPLLGGVEWTVTIDGVTDAKGDGLEAPFVWSFTTVEDSQISPPVLIEPMNGAFLRGSVDVLGSLRDPDLTGHVLVVFSAANPDPITLAGPSPDPIENGRVAVWDTSAFADGSWTLVWQALYANGETRDDTRRVVVDNTPPDVSNVRQSPEDLSGGTTESVRIRAEVEDAVSGVNPSRVEVLYALSEDDGPTRVAMRLEAGDTWSVSIPLDWSQAAGQTFSYRVVVEDEAGNITETPSREDVIEVTDQPPVLASLPVVVVTENERAESALALDAFLSDADTSLDALRITLEFDRAVLDVFLEADRSLTITPGRDVLGVVDATVIVRDPQGGEARGLLRVDVRPDRAAPIPNPSRWSLRPISREEESVTMRAETAEDPNGVEYYFEETSGAFGGDDSGWQSSSEYTDRGLVAGQTYTYRVRTRDRSRGQNTGDWSSSQNATLPGSCDVCRGGARQCSADVIEVCQADDRGCLVWSSVAVCQGRDRCEDGACVPACEDDCPSPGLVSCEDEASTRVCGQFDDDACLDWGPRATCGPREVCAPGEGCVPRCPPDALEPSTERSPAWVERGWYRDLGLCGEEDWYQIDVPASHIVEFGVYGEDADMPMRAEMFNADSGEQIDGGEGLGGSIELDGRAFASMRVFVRVWSDLEETERYDLRVDLIPFERDTCSDAGARECTTSTEFRMCDDLAGDGQLQWSEPMKCAQWEECVGAGECVLPDPPGPPVRPEDRLPDEPSEAQPPAEPPFVPRNVSTCSSASPSSPIPQPIAWLLGGVALWCLGRRSRRRSSVG